MGISSYHDPGIPCGAARILLAVAAETPTRPCVCRNEPLQVAGQHRGVRVQRIRHRERGARIVEASEAAEDEWVKTIVQLSGLGREFLESCTPGYYNNEGKLSERAAQSGFYGAGSVAFFALLAAWRAAGDLKGLELR
jgi:hypothetical protein